MGDLTMSNFSETFVNPPKAVKETKALLVIGGITYKNYALGDLINLPACKEYSTNWTEKDSLVALGNANTNYSMIKEINCESLLDSKTLNFLGKLWLLGLPARLWDRFGDYFKIICNKKIMQAVVHLVEAEILQAQKKYGQVDVIAHSLGTLILLASNIKVNNVYLCGSPLTSRFWSIRTTANNFFKSNNNHCLATGNVYYCHSKNDPVGTYSMDREQVDLPDYIDCSPISHAFSEYIKTLIERGVVTL
jgi:hypothetical protein